MSKRRHGLERLAARGGRNPQYGPAGLPAKLTHYVGKPIRFRYKPEDADSAAKVSSLHRRVLRTMKAMLKHGIEERERTKQEGRPDLILVLNSSMHPWLRIPQQYPQ